MTAQQKKIYPQVTQEFTEEGYPVLKFHPNKRHYFEARTVRPIRRSKLSAGLVRREEKMKENQDWASVWPTAKTFVPSAVPLPIRQSYEDKRKHVPIGKYLNNELLKIPNFLHLTPIAIERHCKALLQFCTKWPKGLESDEQIREHFPVTYITRDYFHSSPSIRDPKSRIVDLKININDLKLKQLDREKLILLARHRYDPNTEILTITTDSCPLKIQNKDYAEYLLTALYFESIKHDPWEFDEELRGKPREKEIESASLHLMK